jgi:hypothetical protein
MRNAVVALAAVLAGTSHAGAEPSANGQGSSTAKPAMPVIRISVDLIQIDVVVTDKKGRHVMDLGPSDFEVREDGRLRTVSNVSYVRVDGDLAGTAPASTAPVAFARS